mmetsp:Transcript_10045/g.34110  ORF Transcript_10045/g.34110 Transcript_10045/m.34110 type:complete len:227 (+) Transcript_10045:345-1025(+)
MPAHRRRGARRPRPRDHRHHRSHPLADGHGSQPAAARSVPRQARRAGDAARALAGRERAAAAVRPGGHIQGPAGPGGPHPPLAPRPRGPAPCEHRTPPDCVVRGALPPGEGLRARAGRPDQGPEQRGAGRVRARGARAPQLVPPRRALVPAVAARDWHCAHQLLGVHTDARDGRAHGGGAHAADQPVDVQLVLPQVHQALRRPAPAAPLRYGKHPRGARGFFENRR